MTKSQTYLVQILLGNYQAKMKKQKWPPIITILKNTRYVIVVVILPLIYSSHTNLSHLGKLVIEAMKTQLPLWMTIIALLFVLMSCLIYSRYSPYKWKKIAKKYEPNSFAAYSLKAEYAKAEQFQHICFNCYSNKKLSPLSRSEINSTGTQYICNAPDCKATYLDTKSPKLYEATRTGGPRTF